MDMATTTDLETRVRELEEKLRAMESESDRSMRNVLNEIIPPDTRKHMRAAWREELLAVRSVLDHWIERQDENVSGAKRRESIRVD